MKALNVIQYGHAEVVDSREVARMVENRHSDLLDKIAGYCQYLANGKFRSLDFFIPNTYQDAQGKDRPCYLLTKKGCDMVANKMTGEKGVLFTAAYVTAFEQMREHIRHTPSLPDTSKSALAEARLRNSRTREASLWLKIAKVVSMPAYKEICAHYASTALAGREVLPLPEVSEKLYTAAEVGEMLGGISANKIGRTANQHGLKTPGYGVEVWDKSAYSSKQISAWRYNTKAIERIREILADE